MGYNYSMETTLLVIPDLQIPLQDQKFVNKLLDVTCDTKPDKLLFIGDLTDSTEVGRWVKGSKAEHGDLQKAFDKTAQIVADFRSAVGSAEMFLQDSNHDARTAQYVRDNAPALASLRALELPNLIGLTENLVTVLKGPTEVIPGVVSMHGHEIPYSSVPGKMGVDTMKKYGKHVIMGHTHQPLIVTSAVGFGGKIRNLWSMNVGHGMDLRKATYLKDGHANWTQGFGVVRYDGRNAYPELVTAINGKFHFNGRTY